MNRIALSHVKTCSRKFSPFLIPAVPYANADIYFASVFILLFAHNAKMCIKLDRFCWYYKLVVPQWLNCAQYLVWISLECSSPHTLWLVFLSTLSSWVRPGWLITEIMESKHTPERLSERATGGTLSCVLSMKSQPVRMSHIPGWTKEEVGLSPLGDTAGMRLRGKGNRKMEKCTSLGRIFELLPPLSCLTDLTSPVLPSRFLWTCCLIRCPFTPVNTLPTEWGYRASMSFAHTHRHGLTGAITAYKFLTSSASSCGRHSRDPGT